jgi:hypothetical protein
MVTADVEAVMVALA